MECEYSSSELVSHLEPDITLSVAAILVSETVPDSAAHVVVELVVQVHVGFESTVSSPTPCKFSVFGCFEQVAKAELDRLALETVECATFFSFLGHVVGDIEVVSPISIPILAAGSHLLVAVPLFVSFVIEEDACASREVIAASVISLSLKLGNAVFILARGASLPFIANHGKVGLHSQFAFRHRSILLLVHLGELSIALFNNKIVSKHCIIYRRYKISIKSGGTNRKRRTKGA